jgi:IS5 family transposase
MVVTLCGDLRRPTRWTASCEIERRQRTIKAGETPNGWAEQPARLRQKDLGARWTKKHGQSHYGYKNHINIDRTHKLVRAYTVTDAARHDSGGVSHLVATPPRVGGHGGWRESTPCPVAW